MSKGGEGDNILFLSTPYLVHVCRARRPTVHRFGRQRRPEEQEMRAGAGGAAAAAAVRVRPTARQARHGAQPTRHRLIGPGR